MCNRVTNHGDMGTFSKPVASICQARPFTGHTFVVTIFSSSDGVAVMTGSTGLARSPPKMIGRKKTVEVEDEAAGEAAMV